ncbi:hypothetical protein [Qipengyuania sphaerica]|uniref:hypothetical protein n=1 Tax=Qipengyuania sphaerica TaxID=2867243 RepID=UPI001C882DB7|nr:hypothetical protein [Qipengyuania sphaerica]MBX7540577.1 hypothetical protein [Qipengyuania sphaerica]
MLRVLSLCLGCSLAACNSGAEDTQDNVGTEEATVQAPEFFSMGPGVYDITGGEGVVYATSELRADGTYIDSAGDQVVGNGTWTADGPNVCFDPEGDGEDQQERCWTNSPLAEDGSFVTTRDDGSQSYTVTPRSE